MIARCFLVLLFLVATSACAKSPPPPPKPTSIVLEIQSSADLNPNAEGRASPLALRVYELKSLADFDKADFVSLYGNDKGLLGSSLVQKHEFILQPEDRKSLSFETADDTKAIAAFAAYRELEQAQWRATAPVVPHKTNNVVIKTGANKVEMSSSVQSGTAKGGK